MAANPAERQTSAEPEFTAEQIDYADRLMNEVPRIEDALKTFLSKRMAESLTQDGAPGESGAAASARPDAAALQGCARVVLKTINGMELSSAEKWSQRHPQREDESGMSFMTRIGSYKVVHTLWARCRHAGQKPAKLLGRSALQQAYPEVMLLLLGDLTASAMAARATEEQLHEFVEGFAACLVDEGEDVDLVWSTNFKAALAARQDTRKAEAAERVQRAADNEAQLAELRASLSPDVAPSLEDISSSTVQVEELGG